MPALPARQVVHEVVVPLRMRAPTLPPTVRVVLQDPYVTVGDHPRYRVYRMTGDRLAFVRDVPARPVVGVIGPEAVTDTISDEVRTDLNVVRHLLYPRPSIGPYGYRLTDGRIVHVHCPAPGERTEVLYEPTGEVCVHCHRI